MSRAYYGRQKARAEEQARYESEQRVKRAQAERELPSLTAGHVEDWQWLREGSVVVPAFPLVQRLALERLQAQEHLSPEESRMLRALERKAAYRAAKGVQ